MESVQDELPLIPDVDGHHAGHRPQHDAQSFPTTPPLPNPVSPHRNDQSLLGASLPPILNLDF